MVRWGVGGGEDLVAACGSVKKLVQRTKNWARRVHVCVGMEGGRDCADFRCGCFNRADRSAHAAARHFLTSPPLLSPS